MRFKFFPKMEEIFSKSRDFFELPSNVKNKYKKMDAAENFHGFTSAEDEKYAI